MSKDLWRSKTLWFNLLAGLIAVANQFGFGSFEADPSVNVAVLGGVALVNLILRYFFTNTSLRG